MKKLGIAFLGLALFVMASFPNQAKAFSVNGTDMYLILSGGASNEYYYDLGTISSVLTSGVTINGIQNPASIAATAWSVLGDTGLAAIGGSVYFASQSPTASLLSGNISTSTVGMDSTFQTFSAANTCVTVNDCINSAANPNSYASNMTAGGSFGGNVPTIVGTTQTGIEKNLSLVVNGQTSMNIYTGVSSIAANKVINFTNMIATLTYKGATAGYSLTIGPAVSAVPLPPSLVMFATGLIALGLIARRKQVGF